MAPIDEQVMQQAFNWLIALQDERGDADLQRRFEFWLAQSPQHESAYRQAQRLWDCLEPIKSPAWSGQLQANVRQRKQRRERVGFGVGLLLLVSLSVAVWREYDTPAQVWTTAVGEQRQVTLADGSVIRMNGATQIEGRVSWWRRELVLVRGEALFNVRHQAFPVFSVAVDGSIIRDVGTQFDVRKQENGVQVAVLEGEVALSTAQHPLEQRLGAGFVCRIDRAGQIMPSKVSNSEHVLAWTEGRLLLNATPLGEVIDALQMQHAVRFVLDDPHLAQQTLSGSFQANNLQGFLQALEKILPVRVSRHNEVIVLKSRS